MPASKIYIDRFPEHRRDLYDLEMQSDHGFIDRPTFTAAVSRITGISEIETAQAFVNEYVINRPFVDYIKQELKPHYKVGMISNIGRGWMQDFFDAHSLHELFDTVILSGDEGVVKPDPAIFTLASSRINVSPHTSVFIDDVADNCRGAETAGMKSIMFTSTSQTIADITQLLGQQNKEHSL